jgi:hypothetical protein
MEWFAKKESIVRRIWGNADTILFIFAGAAAEFALNKAVDWLYFTGRLPADPIGRLFSTVTYARHIVFSPEDAALAIIDKMRNIHADVENKRGASIPDWAYRDVLFMLIHYSVASFELLERKMTPAEKQEVFEVFIRVGNRMGLKQLPVSYPDWMQAHQQHLDLYQQYKKHLGSFRFRILKEAQILVVPEKVKELLGLRKISLFTPLLPMYKLSRKLNADQLIKALILPEKYKAQIKALDNVPH